MSKLQQAAVLLGVLCLYGTSALADEQAIQLKSASGRDVVETNCGICHSLDYIQMNSPFQDAKTWQAEVSKMINAFGAPLEPEEAKTVVDYLVSNYGAGGVAPASTAPAVTTVPAPSAIEQQPSR